MYTEFYGLVERPFELTPDQRYLYLSAHHREALAHLTYGVEERKGFVQLTGEVGTGSSAPDSSVFKFTRAISHPGSRLA